MLNESDIDKLANLSRLKLSTEEKSGLLKDIQAILGYVSEIEKVAADTSVLSTTTPLRNVLREDGEPHESGIFTDVILAEAPQREGNYFSVKKILT